jgi:starvation-inducible DNA-binding protein
MSASSSRLPELPNITAGLEVTAALVERYGHVAATTRKGIQIAADAGDQDTSDLLTEISRGMDKWVWFLESHLK